MSAYLCDREHIRYLVEACWRAELLGYTPWKTDHEVGQQLWNENQKSLQARYGDKDDAPAYGSHDSFSDPIDPVQLLKSIACYRYQCCEHDTWKHSNACTLMHCLERWAISKLPGYQDAEWGAPPIKPRRAHNMMGGQVR